MGAWPPPRTHEGRRPAAESDGKEGEAGSKSQPGQVLTEVINLRKINGRSVGDVGRLSGVIWIID